MSAISGICHWDQRPVPDVAIEALANASRKLGPNGSAHVSPRAGLLLQTNQLHFDHYSVTERQPWPFARGSALTWDGRLDNREELLIQLDHVLGSERSDAAIVAAAYERWELESFSRLIGDWSLALWDASKQRLVLARDYMGNRPLYYLDRPRLLAWATCLDALIDACHIDAEPSEDYIAARLTGEPPHHMTPFNGVWMLPAGHHLVATRAEGINVTRYWTFSPATVRYARPDDYTDRLRELFTEAVRVRLRTNQTVWSHLSGGWDSSSIVCLAHRLIRNHVVEAPDVRPITAIWRDSPESDETPYVRAVERWCGLRTHWHEFEPSRPIAEVLSGKRRPGVGTRKGWETPVRQAGGRIVLSGLMGDSLMLASLHAPHVLFDQLFGGHPLRFLQQVAASSLRRHVPFLLMLKRFANYTFPINRAGRLSTRRPGVSQAVWNRAQKIAPLPLPQLTTSSLATRHFETLVYEDANRGGLLSSDAIPDLWWSFPYSHRPLIEFVLAVPPAALWNFSTSRPSMRRALMDVLPSEILSREDKGNAAVPLARSSRRAAEELVGLPERALGPPSQWQIVTRGYVDGESLGLVLAAPTDRWFIRTCIELEVWLRTLAAASPTRAPSNRVDAAGTIHNSMTFATSEAAPPVPR